MTYQFTRLCKIEIGEANAAGLSYDQNFKIEFEISKSLTAATKINTIKIYNLSRDSQQKLSNLIRENQQKINSGASPILIRILAGYAESHGLELLYESQIVNVSNRRQVPDVITEIKCAEGVNNLKNNYVSVGVGGGATGDNILQQTAAAAGLDVDNTSTYNNIKLEHGYSAVGTVKETMNKVSNKLNANWTIEKNKIKLIKINNYTTDTVISLDADSGLIGSPERIDTSGDDTETGDIKHGWKVIALLNPKILPGRRIKIKSSVIDGVYIIDSVVHTGSTLDGNWQSEIEIKDINFKNE